MLLTNQADCGCSIPRSLPCRSNGQWKIHEDETMTPAVYGRGVWDAAKFAKFLEARVHLHLGPVAEPSALNDPVLVTVLLMLLVPGAYAGWRIYTSTWIGNPWIWSTAVLAVFMFATSGATRPPPPRSRTRGRPAYSRQASACMRWPAPTCRTPPRGVAAPAYHCISRCWYPPSGTRRGIHGRHPVLRHRSAEAAGAAASAPVTRLNQHAAASPGSGSS